MDQLLDFIEAKLPNLSITQRNQLQKKLEELGVEDIQGLQYVEAEDFKDILKLVPARRIIQQAKEESATSIMKNTDLTSSPEIPQSQYQVAHPNTSASTCTSDSDIGLEETSCTDSFWAENFVVPWHLLPKQFLDACKANQRPSAELRRAAIRTLSYSILESCKKPTSCDIDKIASKIVSKYPDALGDIVMGKMLESGYSSLKKNILDRVHNLNRRTECSSSSSSNGEVDSTVHIPSSQYGCLVWSVEYDKESEEQLKQKMTYMQKEYAKNESDNGTIIEEYMMATYPLQRNMINHSSSGEVGKSFPYIFNLKYLGNHFKKLTGFDLSNYKKAEKKKLAVIHCLRNEKNTVLKKAISNLDQHVMETNQHLKFVAFIELLLCYFKEDQLLEYYQPCVNVKQVEEVKRKEGAPIIAVIGDLYSALYFHVVLEGKVRATLDSVDDAVMLLFGLYYVFNLGVPFSCSTNIRIYTKGSYWYQPCERLKETPCMYKKWSNFFQSCTISVANM